MLTRIRRFLNDSSAATSVEYAVMLALILMAVIGAVATLGNHTASSFNSTNSTLFH
jgi:Flp pilus assembly pilin Flp